MKIHNILLVFLIFMIAFKYTKVLKIPTLWVIAILCLWFFLFYIHIHLKNKERATPKPVYLTN